LSPIGTFFYKYVLCYLKNWNNGVSAAIFVVQNRPRLFIVILKVPPPVPPRVARFFLVQNSKMGKNMPNYHELYQMSIKLNKRL
jgi:hypothetical protein